MGALSVTQPTVFKHRWELVALMALDVIRD